MKRLNRRGRIPRKMREGMTIMEIMIVLLIIGLIAGTTAVALVPTFNRAKVKNTRIAAGVVQSAAESYLMEDGSRECPTIENLVDDGILDRKKKQVDEWGNAFVITCERGEVTVTSPGPDEQTGTEDDITPNANANAN